MKAFYFSEGSYGPSISQKFSGRSSIPLLGLAGLYKSLYHAIAVIFGHPPFIVPKTPLTPLKAFYFSEAPYGLSIPQKF